MGDLIGNIAYWAVEMVYSFGYIGIAVLIGLINLHVLPIPTQLILCLAGFLVGQGQFTFALVLLSSTVGAVAASLVLYYLGAWIGESNLHRLVKRFERFKLIFLADLERASEVFGHHGGKAILIGHLFPGIGALISIPAGIKRMPVFGQFLIYTVLGSALWNGGFIILGLVLGARWPIIEQYASIIEYAALATIAGAILWFVWRRRKAYR